MSFDFKFIDAVVGSAQSAWSLQAAAGALSGIAPIGAYPQAALASFHPGPDVASPLPASYPSASKLFCRSAPQVFARTAELAISSALVQGHSPSDADEVAGDVARALRAFGSEVIPAVSGMDLEGRVLAIHRFMKSGQDKVFTTNYIPLRAALRNLARRNGMLGDCHNMSLVFCMLASHAGIASGYHADLFHSFATATDGSRTMAIDFAYGDENLIDREYTAAGTEIVHRDSGRICRRLSHAGVIALFLNRYGVERPHNGRGEAFLQAIEINPDYAEAYANAGDVAFASGHYERAEGLYAEAVVRERWNVFFRLNLVIAKFVQDLRMDRSRLMAELGDILRIYPTFREGHYFKYLMTGDEDALAAGREAMDARRSNVLLTYCREMKAKLFMVERLAMPGNRIFFFRQYEKPYGVFSNFAPYGFELDGLHWRTVEHYFQANRFAVGSAEYNMIRAAATPSHTKTLSRKFRDQRRPDFDSVRDDIMMRAVRAKFNANPELARLLIETGDAVLVENSPTDAYWGCGIDGTGQNRLGAIFMQVREELKREG